MAEIATRPYPNILAQAYHAAYKDELPPWEEFADSLLESEDETLIEDMAEYLYNDKFSHMEREDFDEQTGLGLYRDHLEGPGFVETFTDSFTYSLVKANPMMVGETAEAVGVITGSEGIEKTGARLKEWAEGLDVGEAPSRELQDIDSVKSFFQWLGQAAGSGLGSTAAPIVAGAAGTLAAGPIGGIAGAALAAAPMNMGEIYAQLKAEGVPKEDAASAALLANIPITTLDVIGVGRLLQNVPGSAAMKQALGQRLAGIAAGAGAGAATEGATEAGQSAIREVVAASMTQNPNVQKRLLSILNEGAVGAVTGGAIGGATGAVRQPAEQPVSGAPAVSRAAEETVAAPVETPATPPASPQVASPEQDVFVLPEMTVTEADAEPAPTPQPFLPPDEERSYASLILEEEQKAGARRKLDPAVVKVGDRVLVDNPRGQPEEGTVSEASENLVRVINDGGSPIGVYVPGVESDLQMYEIVPDQKELEKQEKEAQRQKEKQEREAKREAEKKEREAKREAEKKAQEQKRAEEKEAADQAERDMWREEATRAMTRIEQNPDDVVSVDAIRKLRGDKRFTDLPAEQRDKVDDFLLQVRQREEVGKLREKTEEGEPAPAMPAAPAAPDLTPIEQEQVGDEVSPVDDVQPAGTGVSPVERDGGEAVDVGDQRDVAQGPETPAETERQTVDYKPVKEDTVVTSAGTEHPVEYVVVEAQDLIASHDQDGNPNPAYPQQLQPRERGRESSQLQIQRLAQDIRPQLLAESPVAESGSPIIAPSGVVESGNARTIALKLAYDTGKADTYRAYLEEQGYGVEGMRQPVLVRIRTNYLTQAERQAFTREANQPAMQGMSRTEQAFVDSDVMPEGILARHEGGDLTMVKNLPFVQAFIQSVVPQAEQTNFASKGGELSVEGRQRMEAALIAKAYNDRDLVTRLTESVEQGRATIKNALLDLSPRWARMREKVAAGELHADIDQTQALTDAVTLIARNEETKTPIREMIEPGLFPEETPELTGERGQMTRTLLSMFYRNPGKWTQLRAAKDITAALDQYLAAAEEFDPRTVDMFEGAREPQPAEMLTRAREEQEDAAPTEPGAAEPDTDSAPTSEERGRPRRQELADARLARADRGEQFRVEGIDAETYKALRIELADIVTRMAPGTFLRTPAQVRDEQGRFVAGKFSPNAARGIITVAMSGDPASTLRHEVIHALRSAGLFTEKEWQALTRAADKQGWLTEYRVRELYPELYDGDTPTETAVEEAVAYAFEAWARDSRGYPAAAAKIFVRIREFFQHLISALRGMEVDVPVNSIFEDVEIGIVGQRQAQQNADARPMYKRIEIDGESDAPPALENEESEARLVEAEKGIQENPLLTRLSDAWSVMIQNMTRHFKYIERTPENADLVQKMLHLEAQAGTAQDRIANIFKRVVGGLSDGQLRTLTRYLVFKDLLWTAEQGMALPFGLKSIDEVALELRKLQAKVDSDAVVKERAAVRQTELDRLRMEMVDAGVLTEQQARNPHYFRHQVLSYAKIRQAAGRGKKITSSFWHSREGSEKDINANYMQAEAEWMFKAINDISTMRFLNWLKGSKYDKKPEYVKMAKARNRENLEAALKGDEEKARAYASLSQQIASRMQLLRDTLEDAPPAAIGNMPRQLQGQLKRLQEGGGARVDEGTGIFGAVSWLASQSPTVSIQNAARAALAAVGNRKQWVRNEGIPEQFVDPMSTKALMREFGGDNDAVWQPDSFDGKTKAVHIFTGKSIPEHVADSMIDTLTETWEKVLEGQDAGISPEAFETFVHAIRDQKMIGGPKHEMILDASISETLNEFHDREATEGLDAILRMVTSRWKQWVLFNPRRFIKYILNNRTGDLDALLANPSATGSMKYLGSAFKELQRFYGDGLPTQTLLEAMDKGVVQSGLTVQEVQTAGEAMVSPGGDLTIQSMRDSFLPTRIARRYFETVRNLSRVGENTVRYAAYLHYRNQIVDQGKPIDKIGYGATPQWVLQGVSDPLDVAAVMARDALGDYGNISVSGLWARNRLVPFVSWVESNTVRYANLFRNAYLYSRDVSAARGIAAGAYTAASMFARLGIFYGIVQAWNNLFFGDEEDELSTEERIRMHLHVGKWGDEIRTIRFQGALSDFLGWFGMEDVGSALTEIQQGRASVSDVLTGIIKAPVNRIAQGITPIYKVPIELGLGNQFFPDVFNPRAIRDPWEHVLRTFSAENEYFELAKMLGFPRPTRGYGRSLLNAIVYSKDPGEMAYDGIRGKAYNWLSSQKGRDVPARTDARSRALYLHRKALRYGDEKAEKLTRNLMRENKLSGETLLRSKRRAHPLGMLSKADKRQFLKTLSAKERDQLARGSQWYRETYWGGGD